LGNFVLVDRRAELQDDFIRTNGRPGVQLTAQMTRGAEESGHGLLIK